MFKEKVADKNLKKQSTAPVLSMAPNVVLQPSATQVLGSNKEDDTQTNEVKNEQVIQFLETAFEESDPITKELVASYE